MQNIQIRLNLSTILAFFLLFVVLNHYPSGIVKKALFLNSVPSSVCRAVCRNVGSGLVVKIVLNADTKEGTVLSLSGMA